MNILLKILLIGIGSTATMDIYAFILRQFGINGLDYRFLGRWIGYLFKGKFFHHKIVDSPAIKSEVIIGQLAHYAIGIVFAFLLVLFFGKKWLSVPTLLPALIIGWLTLLAPFFIMQPAFGFGIGGSNLPNPIKARLMSFLIHSIYGLGLFLSAFMISKFKWGN
ncbi:DUF2938 family protein [Flammeovirga sp. SJP92]|uniref:DUF2938 family protein n=1 Tax=Flammeovirga sp. SJP92 TaxID=1775430 RepID=UPI00078857D2|nr:DUF2938 family protein [Flammeovirga sp. SJP92]KXX67440.1 hypothetical protein AVL50_29600 [Flammeovirga sp. SJP92]KXX72722.1 hypothetical protein AVL50_32280 [Flammeovirga sp. SJP92]